MTCAAAATDGIAAARPVAFRALQAKLFTAHGRRMVKVMAISDGEATLACHDLPPCGSFAYLVRNGVKLPALIDWTGEDRLGLRFEAPPWTERTRQLFHGSRRRISGQADQRKADMSADGATAEPASDATLDETMATPN